MAQQDLIDLIVERVYERERVQDFLNIELENPESKEDFLKVLVQDFISTMSAEAMKDFGITKANLKETIRQVAKNIVENTKYFYPCEFEIFKGNSKLRVWLHGQEDKYYKHGIVYFKKDKNDFHDNYVGKLKFSNPKNVEIVCDKFRLVLKQESQIRKIQVDIRNYLQENKVLKQE